MSAPNLIQQIIDNAAQAGIQLVRASEIQEVSEIRTKRGFRMSFQEWLIAYGHEPHTAADEYSHPLRVEYEQEMQSEDYENVAEYFIANDYPHSERQALYDFAFYMLGMNRDRFHAACNYSSEQAPAAFEQCWQVFWAWVAWINEVSEIHDS